MSRFSKTTLAAALAIGLAGAAAGAPADGKYTIEVRDAGNTGRATSSNALVSLTVANPSIATPIIGGTIAQQLGYRPLFAVSLVMALGTLFVTLRFLRARPLERSVVVGPMAIE